MNEYIITDTHFFHIKMDKWRDKDYNKKLIYNLKELNKLENVVLYHLGDLGWNEVNKIKEVFTSLSYKKILIRGNHDKASYNKYYDLGFDCICDEIMIKKYGYNIYLSHKPIQIYNINDINIHGHFHQIKYEVIKQIEPYLLDKLTDNHYLLSAEDENYKPVKLETKIIQIRRNKISPTLKKLKEPGRTNSETHEKHNDNNKA